MKSQDKGIRLLALTGRISAVGLTLILVGSAAFGPWVSRRTSSEMTQSQRIAEIDRYLEAAAGALNQENSIEDRFQRDPSAVNLSLYRDAASDVDLALTSVMRAGNDSDRRSVSSILYEHRTHIESTSRVFAAVTTHRTPRGMLAVDLTGAAATHSRVASHVEKMLAKHSATLTAIESESGWTDLFISNVAMSMSILGLIVLGVFLYVLEAFRKRTADIHREELTRFEKAALTDNLTELGNHRAFQEDLRREVSRAGRHGQALSLALIDVDDLKVVNDSNGHQRGDALLVRLAILLQRLRVDDRAFRIGGDEFAVLLPNTNMAEAKTVTDRLRLAARDDLGGGTISIGLASCRGSDRDSEMLRGQADAALYVAKRGGGNAIEAFQQETDGMWLFSSTKVLNLKRLIAEGEMGVAFQPIWDTGRCAVLGYEALARPAEKYGFRGPIDAFDLAERIGKSHELDAVCRTAIFARARDLPANALLFVNICPQSLDHEGFNGADFADLARRSGLTPDRVVLEITERSVTRLDAVVAAAHELRRFGFRLALDDTGAGNSGLEMLSKLPVDFVKIDRMITVNAVSDVGARGVLAGISAIARAIGAYVIAEGIEDEQMLRTVCSTELGDSARNTGLNGVQGYLLGRPSEAVPERADLETTATLLRNIVTRGRFAADTRQELLFASATSSH